MLAHHRFRHGRYLVVLYMIAAVIPVAAFVVLARPAPSTTGSRPRRQQDNQSGTAAPVLWNARRRDETPTAAGRGFVEFRAHGTGVMKYEPEKVDLSELVSIAVTGGRAALIKAGEGDHPRRSPDGGRIYFDYRTILPGSPREVVNPI